MAGSKTHSGIAPGLWRSLATAALPRLAELPPAERDDAAARARDIDFDNWERVGIVAGVTVAAYLLRFDPPAAGGIALLLRYVLQFLAALPLLALLVGPFYLRRTRRGLDQIIARRNLAQPKEVRHEPRPPGS